jgi:hypothetical protein
MYQLGVKTMAKRLNFAKVAKDHATEAYRRGNNKSLPLARSKAKAAHAKYWHDNKAYGSK